MTDLPSNSIIKRARGGSRKVTKIAEGRIIKREKPLLAKVFSDNTRSVGTYIIWDVLIPALKSTITDMISNGVEMLIYGESRPSNLRRDRGRSYVSYSSYYRERNRPEERDHRSRDRHRFEDVVLPRRGQAEEVLSAMVDLVEDYEIATVADFYGLVGLSPDWADEKWGWDNLSSARIERTRDGYVLILPRPFEIR